MKILPTATSLARWGAYLGLGCGVLYSFGGVVVDLLTIGRSSRGDPDLPQPSSCPSVFARTFFMRDA